MSAIPSWVTEATAWLGVVSAIMVAIGLLLVPWAIGKLPHDYFACPPRARTGGTRFTRAAVWVARNLAGGTLVLVGLALLVLPGQGVLTIVLGLCIMVLPGKHGLLRRLVRQHHVWQTLQWMRRRARKRPFLAIPPPGERPEEPCTDAAPPKVTEADRR